MVSHQEQGRAGEILPSLGPFGVLLITVCWNEDLFGGTVIGTQSANSWQELHYRTNETKEMAGAEAERGLLAPGRLTGLHGAAWTGWTVRPEMHCVLLLVFVFTHATKKKVSDEGLLKSWSVASSSQLPHAAAGGHPLKAGWLVGMAALAATTLLQRHFRASWKVSLRLIVWFRSH